MSYTLDASLPLSGEKEIASAPMLSRRTPQQLLLSLLPLPLLLLPLPLPLLLPPLLLLHHHTQSRPNQ